MLLQTIAEAVGDWYFGRRTTVEIDCAYPCDNTCHNLIGLRWSFKHHNGTSRFGQLTSYRRKPSNAIDTFVIFFFVAKFVICSFRQHLINQHKSLTIVINMCRDRVHETIKFVSFFIFLILCDITTLEHKIFDF